MNTQLIKKPNESNLEYISRLVYGKMIDKTVDVDYEELSEYIFGEGNCFNSSEVRKRMYGMRRLIELIEEDNIDDITDKDVLNEIELKKLELKEERAKLSTLRLDLNKSIRNTARFKQWLDEIKQEIKTVDVIIPEYKGINDNNYEKDYLLTVADIHTGRKGESLDNYYDLDVLQDRMWQIRDEIIELVKEKKIKTLKILALGDLIEGLIHVSQIQNLQISRARQTVFVARFLFEWLNSISEYCYVDFKMTTSSNHTESRPLNSKRGEFSDDDYEIIIYEWLSDLCERNPRIKIEGNNIVEFDILGRPCVALHGHQLDKIRNRKNMLADVSFHMNKQYQYMFIAHLHHTEIKTVGKNKLGNQEIIYCPCICGNDEYSDGLWTGASAGSLFLEFNSKQGRRSIIDIILT